MTASPPPWGQPAGPAPWGQPAGPAPWAPAGAPQWGQPAEVPPPPWGPPGPAGTEKRSVLGTVFAHLVLWLGLIAVALAARPITRILVRLDELPVEVLRGALAVVAVAPVAIALVIAGRGVTAVLVGVLGAVALIAGVVVLNVVQLGGPSWLPATALCVLGLGTWIVARRHARLGLLVLVPAAVLAGLWFSPLGLDLRAFPYRHQTRSTTLVYLWGDLPILALGVLGLVASLLRPRPAPGRDGLGIAVVGGLVALTAAVLVVAAVL